MLNISANESTTIPNYSKLATRIELLQDSFLARPWAEDKDFCKCLKSLTPELRAQAIEFRERMQSNMWEEVIDKCLS